MQSQPHQVVRLVKDTCSIHNCKLTTRKKKKKITEIRINEMIVDACYC